MSHLPVFLTVDLGIDVICNFQHDGIDALVLFPGEGDIYMRPGEILFQTVLNLIVVVNSMLSEVKNILTHVIASARAHLGTVCEISSGKAAARQP